MVQLIILLRNTQLLNREDAGRGRDVSVSEREESVLE